jgi:hypothetical protein
MQESALGTDDHLNTGGLQRSFEVRDLIAVASIPLAVEDRLSGATDNSNITGRILGAESKRHIGRGDWCFDRIGVNNAGAIADPRLRAAAVGFRQRLQMGQVDTVAKIAVMGDAQRGDAISAALSAAIDRAEIDALCRIDLVRACYIEGVVGIFGGRLVLSGFDGGGRLLGGASCGGCVMACILAGFATLAFASFAAARNDASFFATTGADFARFGAALLNVCDAARCPFASGVQ